MKGVAAPRLPVNLLKRIVYRVMKIRAFARRTTELFAENVQIAH
jgi:hypothetical protein